MVFHKLCLCKNNFLVLPAYHIFAYLWAIM